MTKKHYYIISTITILSILPFMIFAPMLPINPSMVTGIPGDIGESGQVIAWWAAGRTGILALVTLWILYKRKLNILIWMLIILASVHIYDSVLNIIFFSGIHIEDFGFLIGATLLCLAKYLNGNAKVV